MRIGACAVVASFLVLFWMQWLAADKTGEQKPNAPVLAVLAAVSVYAAWALAMPESPLSAMMKGATHTITSGCIAIGAALLVSLVIKPIKDSTTPAGK